MKTPLTLCIVSYMAAVTIFAQTDSGRNKSTFSVNFGHSIVVLGISQAIDKEVVYLPVHVNIRHQLKNNVGISGLLMYRMDKDIGDFRTNELGIAAGPCYIANNLEGFWADVKIGVGIASGTDGFDRDYKRTDFILQPEIGYNICFPSKLMLTFGIGMQSLLKLSEDPDRTFEWDWNSTGKLSHYYLPVINVSLGFMP